MDVLTRQVGLALALFATALLGTSCSSEMPSVQNPTVAGHLHSGSLGAPNGLKPISYLGLTIDVPVGWRVVSRADFPCGIGVSGVMVGPGGVGSLCGVGVPRLRQATVVTFGGPDKNVDTLGSQSKKTFHGITALVSYASSTETTELLLHGQPQTIKGPTTWEEKVQFPGYNAWLDMGATGATRESALAQAQAVLATVHAS